MRNIHDFFRKIEQNKPMRIVIFIVSMILINSMYFPLKEYAVQKAMLNGNVSFSPLLYTDVTEVTSENGKMNISGWILKEDIDIVSIKVVLKPEEGEEIVLDTKKKESKDATEYANYLGITTISQKLGFETSLKENRVNDEKSYEILLYVVYRAQEAEEKVKVTTSKYLYEERIYTYRPESTIIPNIEDEEITKVICNGTLYSYMPKDGAWIYGYGDCLYWIFDTSVEKNKDENLYVFLHLYTSKKDNLAEDRRIHGYDNRDFILKDREIAMNQSTQFRVAKAELSGVLPITYISTGHYDIVTGQSNWTSIFRFSQRAQ